MINWKVQWQIDEYEKSFNEANDFWNEILEIVKLGGTKDILDQFVDAIFIREEFYKKHINSLNEDAEEKKEEATYIQFGVKMSDLYQEEDEEVISAEDYVYLKDQFLLERIVRLKHEIMEIYNFNTELEELLGLKNPVIMWDFKLFFCSQFLFDPESWYKLLIHDLNTSSKNDLMTIKAHLKRLQTDTVCRTNQKYVKQYYTELPESMIDYSSFYAVDSGGGFNYDLVFGEHEPPKQFALELNIEDFIGKDYKDIDPALLAVFVKKSQRQKGVLMLTKGKKCTQLAEVVFAIVYLFKKTIQEYDLNEIREKISNSIQGSTLENASNISMPLSTRIDKGADFINEKELANALTTLFQILDKKGWFDHERKDRYDNVNADQLAAFFGKTFHPFNKEYRVGLSESSVSKKIGAQRELSTPDLIKKLRMNEREFSQLLGNKEKDRMVFLANLRCRVQSKINP